MSFESDLIQLASDVVKLHSVVHGSTDTLVETEGGSIKTLAGALRDLATFNPRGAWFPDTVYGLRDVVLSTSVVYACITPNTSSSTFAADSAKWMVVQDERLQRSMLAAADLQALVTSLGSTKGTIELLQDVTLSANFSSPEGIEIIPMNGAKINHGAYTISYAGSTARWPMAQIFNGTGLVTLNPNLVHEVYPQWWGGFPDGVTESIPLRAACLAAWYCARPSGINIRHTVGVWNLASSFPYREQLGAPELLDCNNMSILGDGWNTILQTTTPGGGDVLQLNMVKNLTIRDLAITSVLTGFAGAGSNAISITGGFDNLNILDIYTYNMAYVDKELGGSWYPDGGKGVTFQVTSMGTLKGTAVVRFVAKGCTYAFDYTHDLDDQAAQPTSVRVDVTARDCYVGVLTGNATASAALSTSLNSGLFINAQVTDCQHGVLLSRLHGGYIHAQVNSTKTEAAKLLSHYGAQWIATDSVVTSFTSQYTKNLKAIITGNAGACTYKARIGGATQGSSGLNGATEFADFYLDLTGTASIADILSVDSGGNSLRNSRVAISQATSATLPDAWKATSLDNNLKYRGTFTATLTGVDAVVTGTASYAVDGKTVTLEVPFLQGTSDTTAATITGMPTFLYPTASKNFMAINYNSSAAMAGRYLLSTGGLITLYNGVSLTSFTASGLKGTLGQPISYIK